MSQGIVLVTGASGYIAGFVVKDLIAAGWTVRGTIRSLAKADAVRTSLGVSAADLPLFAADLTAVATGEGGGGVRFRPAHRLAAAVGGDEARRRPDRPGARRGAPRRSGGARGRGQTSRDDVVGRRDVLWHDRREPTYSETDWSDLASPATNGYARSKTIAERAARDWVAAAGGGMEYCTINPALVLRLVLGGDFSGSLAVVTKLLNGELPGLPRIGFGICDVRDIAAAHVAAMTTPGIAGDRFLCSGEYLWMADVAAILKSRLADAAKRVPTMKLPDFLVRLSALFDAEIKLVLPEVGRARIPDASHARAMIGWHLRPAAETIVDTARSLIAAGLVKRA